MTMKVRRLKFKNNGQYLSRFNHFNIFYQLRRKHFPSFPFSLKDQLESVTQRQYRLSIQHFNSQNLPLNKLNDNLPDPHILKSNQLQQSQHLSYQFLTLIPQRILLQVHQNHLRTLATHTRHHYIHYLDLNLSRRSSHPFQ